MAGLILIVPVAIIVASIAALLIAEEAKHKAEENFRKELDKLEAKIDSFGKRM